MMVQAGIYVRLRTYIELLTHLKIDPYQRLAGHLIPIFDSNAVRVMLRSSFVK